MAVNTEDVLYNLVYVSVASHPLEEQDLVEFLAGDMVLGRPTARSAA